MSEINPYKVIVTSYRKRTRLLKVESPMEVVDKVTGEVKAVTPLVGNRAYKDTSEFVKLYEFDYLMDLKVYELKVFLYMLKEMNYGGMAVFKASECASVSEMSKSMVYLGLKGLVERDVIRKEGQRMYWVNPNIACKGSRDNFDIEYS